jgi:hypothetical protein
LARAPGRQRLGNKARLVNCRKRWAEICPRADGRGHPRRFRATSRQYRLCVSIGGMVTWQDTLSEWLRRWTRNPLGSARRGSNPLGVALPGPPLIPARCFTSTVKGGLALIPATPGTRPRQYARASSIVQKRPQGLDLPTLGLTDSRSNQLSYGSRWWPLQANTGLTRRPQPPAARNSARRSPI